VQIGVQHTNDAILRVINRGCTNADTERCIALLKDVGFKIDLHLMPDLPSTDIATDERMFYHVLNAPALQADQWKIYPTQTTKFTVIEKWFHEGRYVPFSPSELLALLVKVKCHVHPWIRLNRVIRDIPNQYIVGGNEVTNLRQYLEHELAKHGAQCQCIRCREVGAKQKEFALEDITLRVRMYNASKGREFFISFESRDENTIFGFARLRLCADFSTARAAFPELIGCAMIRELHVYGQMLPVFDKMKGKEEATQHLGFGKRLMRAAETIAALEGYHKVSVIAGIGTRNYYRKLGYRRTETFMIKTLSALTFRRLRVLRRMRLVRTQIPHAEMVHTLKQRTGYDAALTKHEAIEELVVEHYVIEATLWANVLRAHYLSAFVIVLCAALYFCDFSNVFHV